MHCSYQELILLWNSSEHKEYHRYRQEDFDDVFVTNDGVYALELLL